MANDRRFLFEGNADEALNKVLFVGPTPTTLIAAGLATRQCVRVQMLAGANARTADESQWVDAVTPSGKALVLTDQRPYLLLVQPGTMRLHPEDLLELGVLVRVWAEDATYRGTDRIVFNADTGALTTQQTNPATADGTLTDMAAIILPSGNTGPDVAVPAASYYRLTVAANSAATYAMYGYSTDAQLKLSQCEELIVSPEEMARLIFTAPAAGAKLILEAFTIECS